MACLQDPGWNAALKAWTLWWVSVRPFPGGRAPAHHGLWLRTFQSPYILGPSGLWCSRITLTPDSWLAQPSLIFLSRSSRPSLFFRPWGLLFIPQSLSFSCWDVSSYPQHQQACPGSCGFTLKVSVQKSLQETRVLLRASVTLSLFLLFFFIVLITNLYLFDI